MITGQKIAHYEVGEQLGQGGMGIVYRAFDTKLERDVALKFLPPELSADEDSKTRFIQEAKAASALDHPNICTIYEIGESKDGKLFIAMSFYDGQTLKYLLKDGAMEAGRATKIATQIAAGLQKAHGAGIVHRDIKPANIMVTADGLVKILDFGLAKLSHGADLTKAGSTVGTTSYMSPEQSSGRDVDARTDLWSLGVILYELLSGERAFGGGYDQAVLYSVLNEDPEPLDNVPHELGAVVSKLIAKDPEKRFGSAAEVIEALAEHSSGESSVATHEPARPMRLDWRWIAAALVVLLVPALWFLSQGPSDASVQADSGLDPNRIAVMPFRVQGDPGIPDLESSMVTLLSTLLDGAGPIKTVDYATILEKVSAESGGNVGPTLGAETARLVGAGHFVLGSVVKAGVSTRISARLYEGEQAVGEEAIATYKNDAEFLEAVDHVAAGILQVLLENQTLDVVSLASETTSSFEALKHYLNSDAMLRSGQFREARVEIDQALELDSTFALAYVLRSEIMGWIDIFSDLIQSDITTAIRHSGGLKGRIRQLLDARDAFHKGHVRETKRILDRLVRDYPNSVEAISLVAEIVVHFDGRYSEQRRALNMFRRVTELSPGNKSFAMHEVDLTAIKARLTGDSYPLDSLAAKTAGIPVPPRGEELNWSQALAEMPLTVRSVMIAYARVAGSAADSIASYELTESRWDGFRLLQSGHIDLALAAVPYVKDRAQADMPLNLDHGFLRVQGRMAEAGTYSMAIDPAHRAFNLADSVLTATLLMLDTEMDEFDVLSRRVLNWDAQGDPLRTLPEDGEKIRAYLLALVAFRQEDKDVFTEQFRTFQNTGAADPNLGLWESLDNELSGLSAWLDGDLETAAVRMEAATDPRQPSADATGVPLLWRYQPERFLGEIFEEAGDLERAADWYNSAAQSMDVVAPSWEDTGRIYDQMGDSENAIRYYSLFVDYWKNADSVLQPRVRAARDRIDALLAEQTREPQ